LRSRIPSYNQVIDAPVAPWQTIYCSFALILVVFFVTMVSFSVASGKGMKAIRKHFARGSSLHAPGSSLDPLSGIESEQAGDSAAVLIRDATARFGLGNTVRVRMDAGGVDIAMSDQVLFAEGAVDVQKGLYPYLNVIGDVAARNGLHVQVKAHTAGLPGRGPVDRSTWELSAQRAVNVMRYYLAYGRMRPDQVSAAGFGSSRTSVVNNTKVENDAGNRIELHLSADE
jgi:chemotaxis protein MotB